MQRKKQGTTKK